MNKVLHLYFVYRQILNQTKSCMVISARTMLNLVYAKEEFRKIIFPFFLFL